jgi:hypothetical protein
MQPVALLTPLALRCAIDTGRCTPLRVVGTLLPFLVAAPSLFVHLVEERDDFEHVWLHALFALGATASLATIDWPWLVDAIGEGDAPAAALAVYLAASTLTLSLFCLVHVAELRGADVRTHFGDVAVLPLTLVAVGLVLDDVSDRAFVLTRTAIATVPVVVAWATMFFIAHLEFATHRDTRLRSHGDVVFYHVSGGAFTIAVAHLALLETRATAVHFALFAGAAAVFAQLFRPIDRVPRLVRGARAACLRVGAAAAAAVPAGLACAAVLGASAFASVALLAGTLALAQELGLRALGRRWALPTLAMAALPVWSFWDAAGVATVADRGVAEAWLRRAAATAALLVGGGALPLVLSSRAYEACDAEA